MKEVNGKVYPLWGQFVDKKEAWIGGVLEDWQDGMYVKTKITDIKLIPNGEDSAAFFICGKDFTSGFDVGHGGIAPRSPGKEKAITFSGYGGHEFKITQVGELEKEE